MQQPRTMSMMTTETILARLRELGDPADAVFLQRFFKTGAGEYGEGDRFVGIRVPALRALARQCRGLPPEEAERLLASEMHEARLLALLILVDAYGRGDETTRRGIYEIYLRNTARVNNWDLVDSSAEHIVGRYLRERSRAPLGRLARSPMLWERRIAIIATFHYIKRGEFDQTLAIAAMLLDDREDLIHKAVGWMLREIGKRDPAVEEAFLAQHYRRMPRTMLRYAIEKFPEERRQEYLRGLI